MDDENLQKITYFCEICKKHHSHEFDGKNISKQKKFPYPYFFTHKNFKSNEEIFTILYLNKDLKIMSVITKRMDKIRKNPILSEIIKLKSEFKELDRKFIKKISQLRLNIAKLEQKK